MYNWFHTLTQPREEYHPIPTKRDPSHQQPLALPIAQPHPPPPPPPRSSSAPPSSLAHSSGYRPEWHPQPFDPKKEWRIAMDKIKGLVGVRTAPSEEKTFAQEFDEMVSLTYAQRMTGFGLCFVLGWAISLLSLMAVPQIATQPQKFALLYTFGNVISLCSTAFLWGPWKQIRDMFKPVRAFATILYLLSMGLTLFCAFGLQMVLPTIISIVVQMGAMVWYCASYIPYGHTLLKNCMGSCCSAMVP